MTSRRRASESEAVTQPPDPVPRKFISKIPHLTVETAGTLAVLKCRTPSESILVAEELEAADILVIFPDEEEMMQEFKTHGYVSIKVSAQSYGAAKELQEVIECRQWQKKGEQALSARMALLGIGLGIVFFPGLIFFFMLYKGYEKKGFSRKANAFGKWFIVGFGFTMAATVTVAHL